MASAAVSSFLLPHPATLCPPPLQLQKKTRRTTVHKYLLRKSTHGQFQSTRGQGPLDDIIDTIKSDIRGSPPDYTTNLSVFDWGNPLKAPSTWAVTPLPVSRAPSDQPLTIRKNRNSRSSASGSSMGDSMSSSHGNSHGDTERVGSSHSDTTPWPSFDSTLAEEPTDTAQPSSISPGADHATAKQITTQRRPSRLRLFTNGLSRLRRTGTGDTSASTGGQASETTSPSTAASCAMMERVVRRLPSSTEKEPKPLSGQPMEEDPLPTTLRAAMRIFPEVKVLTAEVQDFSVAIEIEGVLQNRYALADGTVDVIFLVDNGYYVTEECLEKATEAVNGALWHLKPGDRLALYTTHCVHTLVSGNKPEVHYPLDTISTDTEEIVQDLTATICRYGTQAWEPVRPNPSMTDVVISVARSLTIQGPRKGRTHLVLLSPAAYVLHDVSKTFPGLSIHRINPAAVPFRREPELEDTVCFESCCTNVFVSNWSSYQSVADRIKRILKNARSKSPVGNLTNISLELRARDGCEIIEYYGRKEVSHLRLGQVHTVFATVRVTKDKTRGVDLDSVNPLFNSSLNTKGVRQEVQNAITVDAIKVHLFDVQLLHQNSLYAADSWNYTETPLITIRELGDLAPPLNTALEVYKRQYFHKFTQLTTDEATNAVAKLLAVLDPHNEIARKAVACLHKEIACQVQTRKYEQDKRQKLPLCPGPIDIEPPHEWYLELWDKRKDRRHELTGAVELSSLVEGLERLA